MQALNDLSQNVHLLLERYQALQQENGELLELQQKNRRLATANAMTSAENAEEATKRINALIAQVDRAIAALKK